METFAAYAIIVPFYAVIVNDLGINICLCCLFSVYIIVLSAPCPDAWAFARCKGCPADTLFACPKRGAPFACDATSAGRVLAFLSIFCGKASTSIERKTLTKPLCPALCGTKQQLRGIKTVRGKRPCPTCRKKDNHGKAALPCAPRKYATVKTQLRKVFRTPALALLEMRKRFLQMQAIQREPWLAQRHRV